MALMVNYYSLPRYFACLSPIFWMCLRLKLFSKGWPRCPTMFLKPKKSWNGWSAWWWLEHGFYDFPHIYIYIFLGGGISSSQLTLTPFFRGVGQPPTSDSTSSDSTSSPVKSGGSDGQVPVLRQWMHQSAQPPKVGFDMEDGCYGSNLGIISMWFI